MSLILATINGVDELYSTCKLHCIETTNGQTEISFNEAGSPSIKTGIIQTLSQIYNQQNVSGKNLSMLRVTRREDGKVVIYFTQNIEKIVRVTKDVYNPNTGIRQSITTTEILFLPIGKYRSHKVDVNEDLAAIMAQQSTNKDLQLMLVTRLKDNRQFIYNRKLAKRVIANGTGSEIYLFSTKFICVESPSAIQSALPQ